MSPVCSGKILAKKDGRAIIDCKSCGYFHVFPMYSAAELESFYKDDYSESTPSYPMQEKVYNIKKWKKSGSVLDIGCWEGIQLEYFLKEGFKCTGIELNQRASKVARAKGVEVYNISIREFFEQFAGRKWNVINIAYILEHIPAPVDFLLKIKDNLSEEGVIIIEVPNEFNPFQLAYIKKKNIEPYWIALPDHLNYFNRNGIENLVRRTGWKIIHGETSFPMEMFLMMGDDYLTNKSVGKKSFRKVVRMEGCLRSYDTELVSQFYSALFKSNIGRSFVLYARPQKK